MVCVSANCRSVIRKTETSPSGGTNPLILSRCTAIVSFVAHGCGPRDAAYTRHFGFQQGFRAECEIVNEGPVGFHDVVGQNEGGVLINYLCKKVNVPSRERVKSMFSNSA